MANLPRLALGTIQTAASPTLMSWAVMDALESLELRVQSFLCRACFTPHDGAAVITGQPPRHLDSWLQGPEQCRELFLRGTRAADLAIVEGHFRSAWPAGAEQGGQLEPLCDWLDLPRLAVVDVRRLSGCRLPMRPEGMCGLLLDGVANDDDFFRLQTVLESLWGIPVLGAIEQLGELRRQVDRLPPGVKPSRAVCHALGQSFLKRSSLDRLRALAEQLSFSYRRSHDGHREPAGLRVAIAYDDAFDCYFPDTLDLLESQGATVSDFSPLADERLPHDTDIVYFGCGHPERFAAALVQNHCLMSALREHVCNGQRVYAEGGGLAYLCEHLELPDGSRFPMAGILPATARRHPVCELPRPIEVQVAGDSWLARAGTRLRGYLNSGWSIEATGGVQSYAQSNSETLDLVGRHQVVGSRVHLNFAAQSEGVRRFFEPHAAALELTAAGLRSL